MIQRRSRIVRGPCGLVLLGAGPARTRSLRGLALYLVALLAMVLFGLGAILSFRSAFTISSQRRVRQSLESRYIAEAALQVGIHHLRHGKRQLTDQFEYGGGKASLELTPGQGPFGEPLTDLLCRGTFQELTTALLAKVEVDPSFLKSSAASIGATISAVGTPPAPAAPGGVHVTALKFLLTLPDDRGQPIPLVEANRLFQERIAAANLRYSETLASLSRAELRWRVYQLAARQLGPGSLPPSSDSEPPSGETSTP